MNKNLGLFVLAIVFLTTVSLVGAQQPTKMPRIGYLGTSPSAIAARIEAFRQGLRELGYVEGKNIFIEWRHVEGKPERMSELAAELVRLKVDIIITGGPPATRAAKEATVTIPIVMTQDTDPVGNGFVASLARPGGNMTGLATLRPEIRGKQLEILKGGLQYLDVLGPKDIETAFRAASKERAEAVLMMVAGTVAGAHRTEITDLAVKSRLPVIYPGRPSVEAGGLMTYGVNLNDLDRRVATYVDKILKGAKPADLPVEQPKKFELIINLKAAKQIGLTIPPNVLARADKVIK